MHTAELWGDTLMTTYIESRRAAAFGTSWGFFKACGLIPRYSNYRACCCNITMAMPLSDRAWTIFWPVVDGSGLFFAAAGILGMQ